MPIKQPNPIAKDKPRAKRQRPANPAPRVLAQAQAVLDGLLRGLSTRKACEAAGMSWGQFCRYKDGDSPDAKDLGAQYARAMMARTEALRADMHSIAADGTNDWMVANDPDNPGYKLNGEHVQRSKLRIDTIKFELSKIHAQYKDPGAAASGVSSVTAEQMQAWCAEVAARLPV